MKNLGIILASIFIVIFLLSFIIYFIIVLQTEIIRVCSGEQCLGTALMSDIVFLVTALPLVFLFIKYTISTTKSRWTKTKKILVFIITLMIILGNALFYIDWSSGKYLILIKARDKYCSKKEECIKEQNEKINSIFFLPVIIKYVEVTKEYRFYTPTYMDRGDFIDEGGFFRNTFREEG